MILVLIRNIGRIMALLPLTFVAALFLPLNAMSESGTLSCRDAHRQIEQTQNTLRPLEQHQQQLQQDVRNIYQKLFACQTGTTLPLAQQQHCTQLQEDGPKQFQAMIKAITLSHQTSQQLAHQTRQVQLACPAIAEGTFPKIASLGHS